MGERMPAEQNLEQAGREPKQSASGDAAAPLFPNNELETLRSRWKEVQTAFGDEPRQAVRGSRWLGGFCDEASGRSIRGGTLEA